MLAVGGEMATEVRVLVTTGMVTVTVALAVTPFMVAVMVTEPAASAEASPEGLIFAIAGLDEVQVAEVVTSAVELSL
jgi:hypothetical protein